MTWLPLRHWGLRGERKRPWLVWKRAQKRLVLLDLDIHTDGMKIGQHLTTKPDCHCWKPCMARKAQARTTRDAESGCSLLISSPSAEFMLCVENPHLAEMLSPLDCASVG